MSGPHRQKKPCSGEYALLLTEALRSLGSAPRAFIACTGAPLAAGVEYVRQCMQEAEGIYLSDRCPAWNW